MTGYRPDELSGDWQFKIVKGTFKMAKRIQAVQDEVAGWGWTLVEVFDENRIRFKLTVVEASKDSDREGNPFRTTNNASAPGCATATAMLLSIGVVVVWMA